MITEDVLSSYGRLRVRFYDLIDVDEVNKHEAKKYFQVRKKLPSKSSCYGVFQLLTGDKMIISQATSLLAAVSGDNSCMFDDEYVFDNVLSSHQLNISLYKLNVLSELSLPTLIGVSTIPIELIIPTSGDTVPILRWYQLYEQSSNQSVRSAIKLELFYEKLGVKLMSKLKAEIISVESRESSSLTVAPTSTCEATSSSINLTSYSVEDIGISNRHKNKDEIDENNISTGIISHCLILGPNLNTMNESEPISPLSSYSGSIGYDSSLCIWDRFPIIDHPLNALPDQIEWFACPEGQKSFTRNASNRPNPEISTFILSPGEDENSVGSHSNEQFGVSITYYVDSEIGSYSQEYDVHNESNDKKSILLNELWYSDDTGNNAQGTLGQSSFTCQTRQLKMWLGIQILVLTGHPYVSQLSKCLLSIYYHCILPRLNEWEKICMANKSACVEYSPLPLNTSAEEFLVQLMYKLPIPIAGMFQISLKIHSGNTISGIQRIGDNQDADTILFACPSVHSLPSCPYPLDSVINALGPRGMINVLCYALSECKMLFHSTCLSKLPGICEAVRILLYPFRWAHIYIPIVPAPLLDLLEAPVPFLLGTHSSWLKHIPAQCLHDVIVINCDTGCIKIGSEAHPIRFPSKIDRWLMLGLKMIMSDEVGYEDTHVNIGFVQSKKSRLDSTDVSRHIQILVLDIMVNLLYQVPDSLFYLAPDRPVFNKPFFLSQQYERDKLLGISQWGICANHDVDVNDSTSPDSIGVFFETVINTYAFHHFTESLCKSSYLVCFLDCVQAYLKDINANNGIETNLQQPLSSKNDPIASLDDDATNKSEPRSVLKRLGLGLMVEIPKLNLNGVNTTTDNVSKSKSARYTPLFPLNNSVNAGPRELLQIVLAKYEKMLHFNHEDRTITYDAFLLSRGHSNARKPDSFDKYEHLKHILLLFDVDSLEQGQKGIATIKLEVIAHKLAVPAERLLAEYKEYVSTESNQHITANPSLTGREVNTDILKGPIVQILALIISGDAENYNDVSMGNNIFCETINQCKVSLQNPLYRAELVRILRQEHSFYVQDSASDAKTLLSRMICLKSKPFELLSTLFNIMLEVCTERHDYTTAYSLLEVGGLYFQVFDVSKQASNTEFLNERIRQHPIYQSPMLWRSVIKDRIPVDIIDAMANHRKIVTPRSGSITSSLTTPRNIRGTALLVGEIKNVLRIMYDLNINVERALIVIQTLVSDYNLPISNFFELQRFVSNLWSNGLGIMNKANLSEESKVFEGNESPKSTILADSKVVEERDLTCSIQASVDRDEVEIKNQQFTDSISIQGGNADDTTNCNIVDVINERNRNVSLNEIILDETTVHGITNCISMHKQLLISGTAQGKVVIHNLENGIVVNTLSHDGKGDKFRLPGVSIVQTASDSNFFISCNNELLKVWKMPVVLSSPNAPGIGNKDSGITKTKKWSYSNKEENSMRLAIIKSHRSSICKTAIFTDNSCHMSDYVPTNYTWFIASGDTQGDVCLSRGSECDDKKLSTSTMITSSVNNDHIKSPSNCLSCISAINFLDTHKLIAYGYSNGVLTIADTSRGVVQEQYNSSHTKAINFLLPVRTHELLTASSDRMMKLWDIRMKQEKVVSLDNKYNSYAALGPISAVSIGGADDNSLLACGSTNGVINIWDIRYNYQKSCRQLVGHTGRVTNISWLINDEIIRTSATDGTIRFWDSLSGLCINTIHMYSNHTGLDSMYISSVNPQQELLQLHRLQSKLLNKYYGILSTDESDDNDDVVVDDAENKQESLCFLGVKSFNGNKRAFKLQL